MSSVCPTPAVANTSNTHVVRRRLAVAACSTRRASRTELATLVPAEREHRPSGGDKGGVSLAGSHGGHSMLTDELWAINARTRLAQT